MISLKKPHESCPFAAPCGPRRKKNGRGQRSALKFSLRNLTVSAFDSRAQGFSPPLARQRSSCPPPSPNLVRIHPIENHQALHDSAPCLLRAATLPKTTKLELGRGAHLKTPSSTNHTAAASQATGRIAKATSWLHLLRVSPALHPPERPSHTHTPKPGFGGRGHESDAIPLRSCLVVSSWLIPNPNGILYRTLKHGPHFSHTCMTWLSTIHLRICESSIYDKEHLVESSEYS